MQQSNKVKTISSILFFSVLITDQITKHLIHINYKLYQLDVIIKGYLNILYVGNKGSAFSLFADAAPWFRVPFFFIVPLIAMIIIVILMKKSVINNKYEIYSFSLILGGALGNFVDRLHYGYVVDFIQIHYKNYYWPVFNVADIALTVGVIMLFVGMNFSAFGAKRKNKDDAGKRMLD